MAPEALIRRVVSLATASLLAWLVAVSGSGAAQASNTPVNGITVSPAIEQLQLTAQQTDASFTTHITNNTANPVQIKLGFADFKSLNETGGIAFLGQKATALEKSHGLSDWVQLATQQVGLAPGDSTTVDVNLVGLNSLAVGGHYGAVTYQVLAAGSASSGNHVDINQVLTSLVFVTTAGQGTQHLSMPSPHLDGIQYSLPSSLDLFFKNDGNTQTVPRGSVTIYHHDPSKPVAEAVINTGSAMVLPGSTRLLSTPLTITAHPWWPHEYHVHILYRPDNASKFAAYDASFLYINPLSLLALIILLIAILNVKKFIKLVKLAPRIKKKPKPAKRQASAKAKPKHKRIDISTAD